MIEQIRKPAFIASVLIAGCRADDSLAVPSSAPLNAATTLKSPDVSRAHTASQRIAALLPEFGGAFIDSRRTLNIYLTNETATGRARAVLSSELGRQGRPNTPLRIIPGRYSYIQLSQTIAQLMPYLGPPGIAYFGIDEWHNRIQIGVVSPAAKSRLLDAVRQMSLPEGVISLESANYFTVTGQHQLTDNVRPLIGGLQVSVGGLHGEIGTLTSIATLNGVSYGVLASHVADNQGNGAVNSPVYQSSTGGQIGTVAVNPPFAQSISSECPSNARCRFSDAALVSLSGGITGSFGSIAKLICGPNLSGGTTGITFEDTDPVLLTDEGITCPMQSGQCFNEQFPGDSATKIGYASGWTGGEMVTTNLSQVGDDGLYRLENVVIKAKARNGDSGGPVLSSTRHRLAGIEWSKGAVNGDSVFSYSVWGNVSRDLAGNQISLHTAPPQILGYESHVLHPPNCPENPDAFEYFLVTGYPDGAGGYETKTVGADMGHTSYNCVGETVNANYSSSQGWASCSARYNGDCPCADYTVGGDCQPRDP